MRQIVEAKTAEHIAQVQGLFRAYQAELPFHLCFRYFDSELSSLPGPYAPPAGVLLLATICGQPVGCVGLRPFRLAGTCEMKRLYLRPPFRGGGLGRQLVSRVLHEAERLGYGAIRLDTYPPTMQAALEMYRHLGFRPVTPDDSERVEGLLYMELSLHSQPALKPPIQDVATRSA